MRGISRIILPGTEADLLRRELARAFARAGCRVSLVAPASPRGTGDGGLGGLLDGEPALLFSVNFQGLNPLKPVLERLDKVGGRAAVWLVDNPWNILAGVRDPRWKSLTLFVTDASFVGPLKAHGAERVFPLPLAADFEAFAGPRDAPARSAPSDLAPFVFVGRSAFPGKAAFFAGQEVPREAMDEARRMLEQGERPDLVWWEGALRPEGGPFWPGKRARLPALGAEEANLIWRADALRAVAASGRGLDIFGDDGWKTELPEWLASGGPLWGTLPDPAEKAVRLRPPVDYYGRLPGIYAAARYSLALTSLQLPNGLNQRHFDVWAAGGLVLSDATPGLSLFPGELVRPIVFHGAKDLIATADNLEKTHDRTALIRDWQACLREGHRYEHRVAEVLRRCV